MAQWAASNHNNADEYVGSALPYVTGSVHLTTTPLAVHFPYVTRWIRIFNDGAGVIRVGFTANGVNGVPATSTHFFVLSGAAGDRDSGRLELKVDKLFVRADTGVGSCSVLAGYTNIPVQRFLNLTGSENFAGIG